jgi:hypothetical protein
VTSGRSVSGRQRPPVAAPSSAEPGIAFVIATTRPRARYSVKFSAPPRGWPSSSIQREPPRGGQDADIGNRLREPVHGFAFYAAWQCPSPPGGMAWQGMELDIRRPSGGAVCFGSPRLITPANPAEALRSALRGPISGRGPERKPEGRSAAILGLDPALPGPQKRSQRDCRTPRADLDLRPGFPLGCRDFVARDAAPSGSIRGVQKAPPRDCNRRGHGTERNVFDAFKP